MKKQENKVLFIAKFETLFQETMCNMVGFLHRGSKRRKKHMEGKGVPQKNWKAKKGKSVVCIEKQNDSN